MKIVYNNIIPFDGFASMTFLCWMFRRKNAGVPTARSLRHETIHSKQHVELTILSLSVGLVLGLVFGFPWWGWLLWAVGSLFTFYLLYVLIWLVEIIRPPYAYAYRDICFDVEAYANEDDPDYLRRRIPFIGWIVCIWDKDLRARSRVARKRKY